MIRRLLPLLFASLLTVLPYAQVEAAPLQQQEATSYRGIVTTTANLRRGPGLDYAVVDQAQTGATIIVVACNEDCSWLQLDNGNWIAAFLVDLTGPADAAQTPSSDSGSSSTDNSDTGSSDTGRPNQAFDPDDLVLGDPSRAALDIIEKILAYTGLPQSFEVYSANIYNAAAVMVNGKRVILYDPQLIADIENITDHDWSAVFIFAHEIGHHLAGHTLEQEYNRDNELEADYFAGFILARMGATLDEAQSVMNLLLDHPNMTDHPPQAERLAAIKQGWDEAARQQSLVAWTPVFPSFADEAAQTDEQSSTPAADASLLGILQQAHDQGILLQEGNTLAGHDWTVGIKAFAAQ
jgi:hypothetical protein